MAQEVIDDPILKKLNAKKAVSDPILDKLNAPKMAPQGVEAPVQQSALDKQQQEAPVSNPDIHMVTEDAQGNITPVPPAAPKTTTTNRKYIEKDGKYFLDNGDGKLNPITKVTYDFGVKNISKQSAGESAPAKQVSNTLKSLTEQAFELPTADDEQAREAYYHSIENSGYNYDDIKRFGETFIKIKPSYLELKKRVSENPADQQAKQDLDVLQKALFGEDQQAQGPTEEAQVEDGAPKERNYFAEKLRSKGVNAPDDSPKWAKNLVNIITSPPTALVEGIKHGGEKLAEGTLEVDRGNYLKGFTDVTTGVLSAIFGGLNVLPAMQLFTMGLTAAETALPEELTKVAMNPLTTSFEKMGIDPKSPTGKSLWELAKVAENLFIFHEADGLAKAIREKREFTKEQKKQAAEILNNANPKELIQAATKTQAEIEYPHITEASMLRQNQLNLIIDQQDAVNKYGKDAGAFFQPKIDELEAQIKAITEGHEVKAAQSATNLSIDTHIDKEISMLKDLISTAQSEDGKKLLQEQLDEVKKIKASRVKKVESTESKPTLEPKVRDERDKISAEIDAILKKPFVRNTDLQKVAELEGRLSSFDKQVDSDKEIVGLDEKIAEIKKERDALYQNPTGKQLQKDAAREAELNQKEKALRIERQKKRNKILDANPSKKQEEVEMPPAIDIENKTIPEIIAQAEVVAEEVLTEINPQDNAIQVGESETLPVGEPSAVSEEVGAGVPESKKPAKSQPTPAKRDTKKAEEKITASEKKEMEYLREAKATLEEAGLKFKDAKRLAELEAKEKASAPTPAKESGTKGNVGVGGERNLDVSKEQNKNIEISDLKKQINKGLGNDMSVTADEVGELNKLEFAVFPKDDIDKSDITKPIILIRKRGVPDLSISDAIKDAKEQGDNLSDYYEIIDGRHRIKKAINEGKGLNAVVITEAEYEKATGAKLYSNEAQSILDDIGVKTIEEGIDFLKGESGAEAVDNRDILIEEKRFRDSNDKKPVEQSLKEQPKAEKVETAESKGEFYTNEKAFSVQPTVGAVVEFQGKQHKVLKKVRIGKEWKYLLKEQPKAGKAPEPVKKEIAPAKPKEKEAEVKAEPKKTAPKAEAKAVEKMSPKEGDTVEIPPSSLGKSPRKMVFTDGKWKQEVAGVTRLATQEAKDMAQKAFEDANKPKEATVAKESNAASEKKQKAIDEDIKRLEDNIYQAETNIEDFQNEKLNAKSNLKEEQERLRGEIAKVKESKLSKAQKDDKIEELKTQLEEAKDDYDSEIERLDDDIANEKADLKKDERELRKLKEKSNALKSAETPADAIIDEVGSVTTKGNEITISKNGKEHKATIEPPSRKNTKSNLLTAIGKAFGKDVVVFSSETYDANGFVAHGDGKTIYINSRSAINPVAIFGHEMLHHLKDENPEAYDALSKVIGDNIDSSMLTDSRNLEEVTADVVGNRMADPNFWNDVFKDIQEKNPEGARTAITQLQEYISKIIKKIISSIGGGLYDVNVKNVAEVNKAVQKAVKDYFTKYSDSDNRGTPEKWKATAQDVNNAIAYDKEFDFMPYTSQGQISIPVEVKAESVKQKYPEEKDREEKDKGKENMMFPNPDGGAPIELPLNRDGTITLFYPTTNEGAKKVNTERRILGDTPESNSISLTNESDPSEIRREIGAIKNKFDGGMVQIMVDPSYVDVVRVHDNGRVDFKISVAEATAFRKKMANVAAQVRRAIKAIKLASLDAPKDKAITDKPYGFTHIMNEFQKGIDEIDFTHDKDGNVVISSAEKKRVSSEINPILRNEHNITTLTTENGKLAKTRDVTGIDDAIHDYSTPAIAKMMEGQDGVISVGVGLSAAQKLTVKGVNLCSGAGNCIDVCLGDNSGGNFLFGGKGRVRSGPRLVQYLKTEAMVLNSKAFAKKLFLEINAFAEKYSKPIDMEVDGKMVSKKLLPTVRLNVTSDIPATTLEPLIKAFPNVMFYDYTKLLGQKPVAPNHHLTYSSDGIIQRIGGEMVDGKMVGGDIVVGKRGTKLQWDGLVKKLMNGENVAIGFSSKKGIPEFVVDEKTGQKFEVWNGDNYDARFIDPINKGDKNPVGKIIGLKNKDASKGEDRSVRESNGFFVRYKPSDGNTVIIENQAKLLKEAAGKESSKSVEQPKAVDQSLKQTPAEAIKEWGKKVGLSAPDRWIVTTPNGETKTFRDEAKANEHAKETGGKVEKEIVYSAGFGFNELVDMVEQLINGAGMTIEKAIEKVRGLASYRDVVGEKSAEFEQMVMERMGKKTTATEEKPTRITGIKNAQVDAERAERGLPPMMNEAKRAHARVWDEAMQAIEDGRDPRTLAEDIITNRRPTSDIEGAILDWHRITIHNEYDSAMKKYLSSNDEFEKSTWRQELDRLDAEKQLNDDASKISGTATARGLAIRAAMVKEDYTLAEVVNKIIKERGSEVTSDEREHIDALVKDFEAKTKAYEDHIKGKDERIAKLEAEAALRKQERDARKVQRTKTRESIQKERSEIIERIKALGRNRANAIPVDIVADFAKEVALLAKTYVAEGGLKATDIVDKVYGDVKDYVDGVTVRDVRDAISGYNQPRMSRKAVANELTGLRSQMRLISKIEDAELGIETKSGKEKKEASDEVKKLKQQLAEILAAQKKPRTVEEIMSGRLEGLKKRTQKRIEELAEVEKEIEAGTYVKKERLPVPLDETAIRLKGELQKSKDRIDALVERERIKNRTNLQVGLDLINKWRREFILSGVHTIGKLSAYAAGKSLLITPAEEIVGGLLSIPLHRIADRAPRHGGFNSAAIAKGYARWFQKESYKSAYETMKTGQGGIGRTFGDKRDIPPEFRSFMGQMHGALKTLPKESEFFLSYEKRMRNAIDAGIDVTDPVVETTISGAAYKDALEAILMEHNNFVSDYTNWIKKKETGSTKEQLMAFTAKFMLPIVKIPMNYVRQTLAYSPVGLIEGAAKATKAMVKGTERLSPEQADVIMKLLKRGSLGTAVVLIGYFNADDIGGYYQPGEKRKEDDVKAGTIRMFGVDIPTWLVHNPVFEALQWGATIRRVSDKKVMDKEDHKEKEQGVAKGILRGSMGVADQVPFLDILNVKTAIDEGDENYWGRFAKGLVEPRVVQEVAEWTDSEERAPKTFTDQLKSGIPVLREQVPVKKPFGEKTDAQLDEQIHTILNPKKETPEEKHARKQKEINNAMEIMKRAKATEVKLPHEKERALKDLIEMAKDDNKKLRGAEKYIIPQK